MQSAGSQGTFTTIWSPLEISLMAGKYGNSIFPANSQTTDCSPSLLRVALNAGKFTSSPLNCLGCERRPGNCWTSGWKSKCNDTQFGNHFLKRVINELYSVVFGITCCVFQGGTGQPGNPGKEGEIGLAVSTLYFLLYMQSWDTRLYIKPLFVIFICHINFSLQENLRS